VDTWISNWVWIQTGFTIYIVREQQKLASIYSKYHFQNGKSDAIVKGFQFKQYNKYKQKSIKLIFLFIHEIEKKEEQNKKLIYQKTNLALYCLWKIL
jgi:hypothetical protein